MARTFLSYEDLRRTGVLSSEARALQYCLDVELLRPNHFCPECQTYMELRSCASTKYSDGYCWSCPGGQHHLSVRAIEASSTTATLPLSTSSTYFGSSSTVPALLMQPGSCRWTRKQCDPFTKLFDSVWWRTFWRTEQRGRSEDGGTSWRSTSRSSANGSTTVNDEWSGSGSLEATAELPANASWWSAQTTNGTTTLFFV